MNAPLSLRLVDSLGVPNRIEVDGMDSVRSLVSHVTTATSGSCVFFHKGRMLVPDLSFAVQDVQSDDVVSFCVHKKRPSAWGNSAFRVCSAAAKRLSSLPVFHRHTDGMLNEFLKVTDWVYDSIDGDRDAYVFYRQLLNEHEHEKHMRKTTNTGPPILVEATSVSNEPLPVLWKTDIPMDRFHSSTEEKGDQVMKT
jgi:hypothetical protein